MRYIALSELDCKTAGMPAADPSNIPPGFDARTYPILSQHWFGLRPVGAIAAQVVQELAFRRKVTRFRAKGDRTVGEMLAEVIARYDLGVEINDLLDRYTDIPDDHLDLTGGRDFPPPPLHQVGQ